MSYIKENLMPNEKILYTAQVSPLIFLPPTISFMGAILFIISFLTAKEDMIVKGFLILIAIMFFLTTIKLIFKAAEIMFATELGITNRRVIAKTGFIHRNTLEMLLPKIESVNVYQNILGRWLNFGNVTITGTGGTKETFRAIIDPITTRKKINQIIEHYAQVEKHPAQG